MGAIKILSSYGTIQFPKAIVLEKTAGAGVTKLFVDTSIGLFSELGVATGASAEEMDIQGPVTIEAFKKYIQTYALIVQQIKYSSNVDSQLNNPIKYVRVGLDEVVLPTRIDIATEKSEDAFTQKLITVGKTPFVWDNQTGIVVGTAATNEVTIAMTILAAIPYANLERFLAENAIPLLDTCK